VVPDLGKFDSRLGREIYNWEIPKNLGKLDNGWGIWGFLCFNLKIIPLLRFWGMTLKSDFFCGVSFFLFIFSKIKNILKFLFF
jgi:hypothetical protein